MAGFFSPRFFSPVEKAKDRGIWGDERRPPGTDLDSSHAQRRPAFNVPSSVNAMEQRDISAVVSFMTQYLDDLEQRLSGERP